MSITFSLLPPYMLQNICDHYKHTDTQKCGKQKSSMEFLNQQMTQGERQFKEESNTHIKRDTVVKIYNLDENNPVALRQGKGFQHVKVINSLFTQQLESNLFLNRYSANTMRMFINTSDETAYNNAFWMPETNSVYFGNVDSTIFNPFINSLDITAHLFAHGFVEYSSQLKYKGQSGALRESIADVFAICTVQMHNHQRADESNWLIAENIFVEHSGEGRALRSMKAPGTAYKDHPIVKSDPQPDHMDKFITTHEDNGGVHINSGIPNRAFYLTAMQAQGVAYDKPLKIWHAAACSIKSNATFQDFAKTTIGCAKSLYGEGMASIVSKSWSDVGVLEQSGFLSRFSTTTLLIAAIGIGVSFYIGYRNYGKQSQLQIKK